MAGITIYSLINSTRRNKVLRQEILDYTRSWLVVNQTHSEVGIVYGAIMKATRAQSDIDNAINWYRINKNSEHSWHVLAELLDYATISNTAPNPYVVKEAKQLLARQQPKNRIPVLLVQLIRAQPDQETVEMAKSLCRETRHFWVLATLNSRAPDQESIALARNSFEQWIDTPIEPEMLYGLLAFNRTDKQIVKRARLWIRNHSTHTKAHYLKALIAGDRTPTT